MAVVGIDFGLQTCYVALQQTDGDVKVVEDESGSRNTPPYVHFKRKSRLIGKAAKDLVKNENTICEWKNFTGLSHDDSRLAEEEKVVLYKVEKSGDLIEFKVDCRKRGFTTDQITAMMFAKLQEIALKNCEQKEMNCVISVPMYFTQRQREVLLNASKIVGLNCLQLLNDTTAAALYYYLDQDIAEMDQSQNIIFVDMGASSLQVSAFKFSKKQIKVLATACDTSVGGRYFDVELANNFSQEISNENGEEIGKKEYIGLISACEKLKISMSDNSQEIPLKADIFHKERTFKMNREKFEILTSNLLKRVEETFRNLLAELDNEPVEEVQTVGGSTRIPAIRKLIKEVFGKDPRNELEVNEAVAIGCAYQCGNLLPDTERKNFYYTYPLIADNRPDKFRLKCYPASDSSEWKDQTESFEPLKRYVWIFQQQLPFILEIFNDKTGILLLRKKIELPDEAETTSQQVEVYFCLNHSGIFELEATANEDDDSSETVREAKEHNVRNLESALQLDIKDADSCDSKDIDEKIEDEHKMADEDKTYERITDTINEFVKRVPRFKAEYSKLEKLIPGIQEINQWLHGEGKDKDIPEDEELSEYQKLLEQLLKLEPIGIRIMKMVEKNQMVQPEPSPNTSEKGCQISSSDMEMYQQNDQTVQPLPNKAEKFQDQGTRLPERSWCRQCLWFCTFTIAMIFIVFWFACTDTLTNKRNVMF